MVGVIDNGFHKPFALGTNGNNWLGKLPNRAMTKMPSKKIMVAQYAVRGSSFTTLASLFSS